jgi:thiosulfate/3-mercaptopyruvate sulfurtransferase
MKSASDLATLFTEEGVDLSRPIVNTCGSGVTAAILALAQSVVGLDDAAVYDGSWAEWGADGSRFPLARA